MSIAAITPPSRPFTVRVPDPHYLSLFLLRSNRGKEPTTLSDEVRKYLNLKASDPIALHSLLKRPVTSTFNVSAAAETKSKLNSDVEKTSHNPTPPKTAKISPVKPSAKEPATTPPKISSSVKSSTFKSLKSSSEQRKVSSSVSSKTSPHKITKPSSKPSKSSSRSPSSKPPSNYSPPFSSSKPKQFKKPLKEVKTKKPHASVDIAPISNFKIPKKAKDSSKTTGPSNNESKRDIGANPVKKTSNVTPKPASSISSKSNKIPCIVEDDFDAMEETFEPELCFDLYGATETSSVELSAPYNPEELKNPFSDGIDHNNNENENEWQEENLPEQTNFSSEKPSLRELDSESEESDDEGNFKRSSKDKDNERSPKIQERYPSQITPRPISVPLVDRLGPPPGSGSTLNGSTVKRVISLSRPASLDTPNLPANQPSNVPSAEQIYKTIEKIASPNEAMMRFVSAHSTFPEIFHAFQSRFQCLLIQLLLNLFCDVNFLFNPRHVSTLFNHMQRLEMDKSFFWEEIITSWGQNYRPVCANVTKKDNLIRLVNCVQEHLETCGISIDLSTARFLFEMKCLDSE